MGTGISGLDFELERFDRVVSAEMFEHMNNHEMLVKRITKWMRPGGRLFAGVSVPAAIALLIAFRARVGTTTITGIRRRSGRGSTGGRWT